MRRDEEWWVTTDDVRAVGRPLSLGEMIGVTPSGEECDAAGHRIAAARRPVHQFRVSTVNRSDDRFAAPAHQ